MEYGPKTWAQVVGKPPECCATPTPTAGGKAPTTPPLPNVTPPAARRPPRLAAMSTAAWRAGRKSQTHAWPRLGIGSPLPHDVLEAILGFLDLKTLRTARLVSKSFCAAGSAHIRTMTCRSICHAVSGQRFPRLARMAVCHSGKEGDLAEVDPSLRDLITSLTISGKASLPQMLSQLALMPKLRELDVKLDVGGTAPLLRDCTNLETLRISAPEFNLSVATTIASMTSLTELHIRRAFRAGNRLEVSCLHRATALRNLQTLAISTASEALPLIGNLTGLTGLTWVCVSPRRPLMTEVTYTIAPLTRLSKLRSARLGREMSASNVDIACSLGAGSLVDLALGSAQDCGSFLARQTALTRLSVLGRLCNLCHIGGLRLELLQSLALRPLTILDAEGDRALRKATSLTELRIHIGMGHGLQLPSVRLSNALASLTRLRALGLYTKNSARLSAPSTAKLLDCTLALRPLTGLTHLEIFGGRLDAEDLRLLLVLTSLRGLHVYNTCVAEEVLPELVALTNLKTLKLKDLWRFRK